MGHIGKNRLEQLWQKIKDTFQPIGEYVSKQDMTDYIDAQGYATLEDIPAQISVSKEDMGLGNVDNTADAEKHVSSANKLETARNINGVSFDGTADITIADSTKADIDHTHGRMSIITFTTQEPAMVAVGEVVFVYEA